MWRLGWHERSGGGEWHVRGDGGDDDQIDLIGGAAEAVELDAERAIRQGAELAARL